jgi:4-amino-4-deoxy-L-arabinose transferase-like glycosyltransferase
MMGLGLWKKFPILFIFAAAAFLLMGLYIVFVPAVKTDLMNIVGILFLFLAIVCIVLMMIIPDKIEKEMEVKPENYSDTIYNRIERTQKIRGRGRTKRRSVW